jgi:hypothetical protein
MLTFNVLRAEKIEACSLRQVSFFRSEFAVTNCRICGTGSITGCFASANVCLDHVRVTVNGQ